MGDSNRINVVIVNNEGGGYGERAKLVPGTKVSEVVETQITKTPKDYTIKVNGQEVTADQQFNDGDRLVISPRKIAGA